MCNDYERRIAWAQYRAMMEGQEIGTPVSETEGDLPRADDVRIGDIAPVMRAAGNLIELAPMRFGFPPPRPGASPVFNFRSDGRRFGDTLRCLVPASAFFEFTGAKYPKAKHRFTLAGAPFLAIAAIWRPGAAGEPPAFSMLTVAPGADIIKYHNRQIAVLKPEDWAAWIYLTKPESELLRPLPAGSLEVQTVRPGRATCRPAAIGR